MDTEQLTEAMQHLDPITKGLRETVIRNTNLSTYGLEQLALACDAVDAIHKALEDENAELRKELKDAVEKHEDAMAEHGWVRLPVDGEAPCKQLSEWIEKRGLITGPLDHDGELWHKGDMSASPWGEIESIVFDGQCWQVCGHDTSAPWLPADSLLHYHAPTVEDVLREFYTLAVRGKEAHAEDVDGDVLAEYAAKLRLAGDAE